MIPAANSPAEDGRINVSPAAALPQIRPERRKHLLQSISEAAATAPGWSSRAPSFYPEWVEKEAA